MLIERERSLLLIVDVQTRLAPAVKNIARVIANIGVLMKAASRLDVPLLMTEHYPEGLGRTIPELVELAPEDAILEKINFCCSREKKISKRLAGFARSQIVMAGSEAHVCVLQSAMGLLEAGYDPFVVMDATSSRRRENHRAAIDRLRAAGVGLVTTEMVVFEWLGRGGTAEFRDLLKLIR